MDIFISFLIGFVWYQVLSVFGASILLHKHYCHNQFKVPVWFESIGLFMLMILCVRSPIGWIASHRMHHTNSDGPGDPHAVSQVGFFKVLTTTWDVKNIPIKYAKDLFKNPRLVFCHRHWLKILIVISILSFLISPYFFLSFVAIPFILAKIGFGLLNTVGHKTPGGANVPWLNFFVAGEGWHRNHHDNFRRVRLHKWDISGYIAEKLFNNEIQTKQSS
tara:strand:+ start:3854 stop:4510 length:657 start_codon:yes stop_codon:yes gene_type:complete